MVDVISVFVVFLVYCDLVFCVWSLAVLDGISGFVVFLVYCDCGCSVFGP